MNWIEIVFFILISSFMPLGMLWIYLMALKNGLMKKDNADWCVLEEGIEIKVIKNQKIKSVIPINSIVKAKYAYDDGWTESKIVEDALNLFDSNNRLITKIPKTANGFKEVYSLIEEKGIKINRCVVDAPSFID
ncbi:MAG: hypothetical protein VB958_02880 [Thalassolituus sp.]|uniref:hypothetical protein n=1 Tax=Thalassolituus sp. TaxID=2030822 RepID=UPI0039829EB9